jgi:phosphatidylglycerophosphatase A
MNTVSQERKRISSVVAQVIASFFYVGYVPIIPGTFGSMATFALYFGLIRFSHLTYIVATLLVIVLGIWAAGRMEKESKIIDPSFVVIDEVAGQLITLFLIPISWEFLLTGFVLFRIFDIVKPFPARQAEQLPGGFGIMLDDVLVGIYANLVLHCIPLIARQFS